MHTVKNITFTIFKLTIIFAATFILSGYGYNGDLPELGKTARDTNQNEVPVQTVSPPKADNQFEFPAEKNFFPRIYSGYNIDRYKNYLEDIKQVEPTLVSLREVIKSNDTDKIQQFSAKVNVLSLYIDNLKTKYGNKPEKNYESYKQLVMLNNCLTQTASYQRAANRYRTSSRGSLFDKLEDESYTRKKIILSLNSINKVLEIIQNAN